MCAHCGKRCTLMDQLSAAQVKRILYSPFYSWQRWLNCKALKAQVGSAEGWQTARRQQACDRWRLWASMMPAELKIVQSCLQSLYNKCDQSSAQQLTTKKRNKDHFELILLLLLLNYQLLFFQSNDESNTWLFLLLPPSVKFGKAAGRLCKTTAF